MGIEPPGGAIAAGGPLGPNGSGGSPGGPAPGGGGGPPAMAGGGSPNPPGMIGGGGGGAGTADFFTNLERTTGSGGFAYAAGNITSVFA